MNKVVYVLVSGEKDYYYEELLVSVLSLRKYNDNVEVDILVDDRTYHRIREKEISKLADYIICKEFAPEITPRLRSRYLKTTMRELIDGDFLFIDCDTLISGSLHEVFEQEHNLAMVLDNHKKLTGYVQKQKQKEVDVFVEKAQKLRSDYYNSGVIYCKDTETVRDFFEKWNQLYIKSEKKGSYQDQPPLNYLNTYMGGVISELDGIWNCQMNCGVRYLHDARIIHYLGFQYKTSPFVGRDLFLMHQIADESIFERMKTSGCITDKVTEIIENPRGSIVDVVTIPRDTITYQIIGSNNFLIMKTCYVMCKPIFNFFEGINELIFSVYRRIKNRKHKSD